MLSFKRVNISLLCYFLQQPCRKVSDCHLCSVCPCQLYASNIHIVYVLHDVCVCVCVCVWWGATQADIHHLHLHSLLLVFSDHATLG